MVFDSRPWSPTGSSINNGISQEHSSLRYTSLDHPASMVNLIGQGALMVRSDIKEAYRIIPIHTHDQYLLGVRWNDYFYTDRMLPFGLCSATKIFSVVADGLQWILTQYGITHILHYLDDFIFVAASMGQDMRQKHTLVLTFNAWEFPLSNPN